MHKTIISLSLVTIAAVSTTSVFSQTPASAAPAAAASTSATVTGKYTAADTPVGTLLDDPAAKAILDQFIPGFTTNEQVDMARGMTLKEVQQYSPDKITNEVLAKIDEEFAKLPK